ncbi:ATP-binding protein [Halomonas sp. NO4]|uniref:ATP-binding protein n=1 Tax=Halomonas sp. NO4 TaxID=2484813 RepID=UPI001F08D1A9|nr:ATP-binding protein [Halomonas sp. NO4]
MPGRHADAFFKLTAIRERLDTLLDEAERRELTLRETLAYLCEQEVAHKEQRRIQVGLSIARFPFLRTRRASISAPSLPWTPARSVSWPVGAGSPTAMSYCCSVRRA